MRFTTLGVWFGFDYKLSIKREGIGRFVFYLIKGLLENFPINCEIWCYDCNYEEMKSLLSDLIEKEEYKGRLKILTENSFKEDDGHSRPFERTAGVIRDVLMYDREGVIDWRTPYYELRASYGEVVPLHKRLSLGALFVSGRAVQLLRKTALKRTIKPLKKILEIKGSGLFGSVGDIYGESRVAEEGRDKEGFLAYGPYLSLTEGYYEIDIHYSYSSETPGTGGFIEVSFDLRKSIIRQVAIAPVKNGVVTVPFWVGPGFKGSLMEVPVYFSGKGRLTLDKVEIRTTSNGGGIAGERRDLVELANKHSLAECFYIPIVILKNGLGLKRPKVVALHDLITIEFYDHFIAENPRLKEMIDETRHVADAYAAQGAFFCSNSEYVQMNHTLKYINVPRENTGYVYVPAYMPDNIEARVLSNEQIRQRYGISGDYLYYPTQIRPHKNVITLVKALKLLMDRGVEIKLVLTGSTDHSRDIKTYIEENSLGARIIFAKDVPEADLFSLYKYSAAAVVPTLFEGGFPMQGLEAMLMDAPTIMARIPVTLERLANEGLDLNDCGIKLFSPEDENELAERISEVLKDRDAALAGQKRAKERLFRLSLKKSSGDYFEVFSRVIKKAERRSMGRA